MSESVSHLVNQSAKTNRNGTRISRTIEKYRAHTNTWKIMRFYKNTFVIHIKNVDLQMTNKKKTKAKTKKKTKEEKQQRQSNIENLS